MEDSPAAPGRNAHLQAAQGRAHAAHVRDVRRVSLNHTPGATRASRSSYFVKKGDTVYGFQLATTDPAGNGTVFACISSKFTRL